jgi:hypothetical protein
MCNFLINLCIVSSDFPTSIPLSFGMQSFLFTVLHYKFIPLLIASQISVWIMNLVLFYNFQDSTLSNITEIVLWLYQYTHTHPRKLFLTLCEDRMLDSDTLNSWDFLVTKLWISLHYSCIASLCAWVIHYVSDSVCVLDSSVIVWWSIKWQ